MSVATPITGIVASADRTGLQVPGETRYGINFTRPDGTTVTGTTGHRSILPYVWPEFARVEPERLIGRRVCGLELVTGNVWWLFVEPIAGFQCGTGSTQEPGELQSPFGDGPLFPPPPPPGGGGLPPASTPDNGDVGVQ